MFLNLKERNSWKKKPWNKSVRNSLESLNILFKGVFNMKKKLFRDLIWKIVSAYFPTISIDQNEEYISEKIFKNGKGKLVTILSFRNFRFTIQILVTDLAYSPFVTSMNGRILEQAAKTKLCFLEDDFISFKDFEMWLVSANNQILRAMNHTRYLKNGYQLIRKDLSQKIRDIHYEPVQLTLGL